MKAFEAQVVKRGFYPAGEFIFPVSPSPKSQSKQIIQEHSIFFLLFLQQESKKKTQGSSEHINLPGREGNETRSLENCILSASTVMALHLNESKIMWKTVSLLRGQRDDSCGRRRQTFNMPWWTNVHILQWMNKCGWTRDYTWASNGID